VLANGRAGLCRTSRHSGPQPFPEFFDASRTLVRIAELARRHLVRATAPAARSRMDVVGSQDKALFDSGVCFLRIAQLRPAVPTSTAALRPEVFPSKFRRREAKFHSSQTVVESLLWVECPAPLEFIAHNVPFMFDNYAAPKECRVGYSKPTAVEAPLAEFHSEACYDVDLHRADLSLGASRRRQRALGQRDLRGDHWKRTASPRKEVSSVQRICRPHHRETMSRRGGRDGNQCAEHLGIRARVTVAWLWTVPLVAIGWAGTILEVGVWISFRACASSTDYPIWRSRERGRRIEQSPLRNVSIRIQNGKLSRSEKLGSAWNVLRPGDSSFKRK